VDGADAGESTGQRATGGARRIAAEVFAARLRARDVLEAAEAEARRIREDAEAEVRTCRDAALQAGREEGLGQAAAELVRGAAERDRMLAACTGDVLDVATAIAARILQREIQAGADAVAMAETALAELRGLARATLRASPADGPEVRAASSRLGSGFERLRVVLDPALAAGEVVVETAEGCRVDGRFRTQLAELRRALAETER
jgi:flagellar biosynthesis/type III secretory pathway protein FliH